MWMTRSERCYVPRRAVCFLFLVAGLAALAGILCLLAGFLIWVLTLLAGLLVWILTLLTWFIVGHRVSFRVGEQRTTMGSFVRSKKMHSQWNFFGCTQRDALPPGQSRLVHISMLATQQRRQYLVANE